MWKWDKFLDSEFVYFFPCVYRFSFSPTFIIINCYKKIKKIKNNKKINNNNKFSLWACNGDSMQYSLSVID